VFPDGHILDFNESPPTHSLGSMLQCSPGVTCEGVISVSDTSGNLIFYSDGTAVWSNTHEIITNGAGLLGHQSSTQSAFVLPRPGHHSEYYLFTTDGMENELQNGLRYNHIEVCSGTGEIVLTQKNTLLAESAGEKLCATHVGNTSDYWLASHDHGTDRFFIYSISESGIQVSDTIAIGTSHPVNFSGAVGQMKFAPDGSKLALTVSNNGIQPFVEIFDFDPLTGTLSNPVSFNPDTIYDQNGTPWLTGNYGLSFSPNSQLLYVAPVYDNRLFQVDVSSYNSGTDLVSSAYLVNNQLNIGGAIHQIQIGPDGKIYLARSGTSYLAILHQPNESGPNCMFELDGISLDTSLCQWGLPAFVDDFNYLNHGYCDSITTIAEQVESSLDIYPNPSNSSVSITIPTSRPYHLTLVNALGKLVAQQQFTTSPDGKKSTVANSIQNLGQLRVAFEGSSGMYTVLLETLDGIIVESKNVVYTK
jgi:hypothetical protein